MSTLTKAGIYELQGYKEEALEIYKEILKKDPHNQEAKSAIKRMIGLRKKYSDVDEQMRDFFININSSVERFEFERWLSKWS